MVAGEPAQVPTGVKEVVARFGRVEAMVGGEDETCKILAQGVDLSRSRREPEFFRDRWRHTIKAQFVMAEAVDVFRFIG